MKRRTAVHKISSLPEASHQQLQQFDDVCAICYQVRIHFQKKIKTKTQSAFQFLIFIFNICIVVVVAGNDFS